jgi:hypothetical protein
VNKVAFAITACFFGIWFGITFAWADHPPPPGFILISIPVRGEPGVPLTWSAPVIWFAVVGTVGAVNAVLVYAVSTYFAKKQ